MKTLRLFLIVFLFSLQANATGFAHNMFVAHKKLQTGKELPCVREKNPKAKVSRVKVEFKVANAVVGNKSAVQHLATKVDEMATLNERILEEGPSYLFHNEEEKEADDSIVAELVQMVKNVIYAFAGAMVSRG